MADISLSKNDPAVGSDEDHDDDTKEGGKGSGKSRRELPAGAVATLKAWLLSPEHFTHPYPTPQDQVMLMQKTGIDKKQLKNWFTNARRRIWKPMLKKQLEQGKLAATGAGGGGVAVPGVVPGLMVPAMTGGGGVPPGPGQSPATEISTSQENPHSVQAMHAHYQQAVQQQQQQQQACESYGGTSYMQQPGPAQQANHPGAPVPTGAQQYGNPQFYSPQQYGTQGSSSAPGPSPGPAPIAASSSIGSLPPMGASPSSSQMVSGAHMNKTDSHAVLMELFARDQDLVRQATESAKLKAAAKAATGEQQQGQPQLSSQQPVKSGSQGSRLGNVPALNSWPHFSSISSLNNLGTMTGVKSITSLSGADLASQGNLNKMGNLAQVKSYENMGRNDSYAFLEVFFGDRSTNSVVVGGKEQRGLKRDREEDNDVGLSLDADESPSTTTVKSNAIPPCANDTVTPSSAQHSSPQLAEGDDKSGSNESGTLKRAYDDALAARGLISVSRSCEKLTDLAIPAKMQRTLSQEYLRHQQGPVQSQHYGQFSYSVSTQRASDQASGTSQASQQYPGQHPGQHQKIGASGSTQQQHHSSPNMYGGFPCSVAVMSDPSTTNASVEVPSATKCALCQNTNVDTQLRPCGHMFHERCLKPSLQTPMGQPKCPIDHIPMQSALLAVPTEDEPLQPQQQKSWGSSSSLSVPAPALSAEASRSQA